MSKKRHRFTGTAGVPPALSVANNPLASGPMHRNEAHDQSLGLSTCGFGLNKTLGKGVVRASLRSASFALSAGGTPAVPVCALRLIAGALRVPVELGRLDDHDGFYGVEEDEGLRIVFTVAII